jgi:hypothetical protein
MLVQTFVFVDERKVKIKPDFIRGDRESFEQMKATMTCISAIATIRVLKLLRSLVY